MQYLTEADFRRQLKEKHTGGYLFFGDEDYLKLNAVKTARDLVCPDPTFLAFNEMRLDALTFTPDKLAEALLPLPMMAEEKLVVVSGLNLNALRKDEIEDLCNTLSLLSEYDYNLCILSVASDGLDAGSLPKRPSPLLSRLSEVLTPVYFEPSTDAKLTIWVGRHFEHHGIALSTEDCRTMIDYCGHSMFSLASEIEKLSYYLLANEKNQFERAAMEQVCTPACEYDAFAFTNALMNREADRALYILQDYKFRRMEPIMILGSATQVICDMVAIKSCMEEGLAKETIAKITRIHEYRVGLYQKSLARVDQKQLHDLLNACLAADASLKSSDNGYAPLERLVCSL
ncbi:MAG: DNA polymerase III subunit delta [Clostridia bacterium]|nr:DNA polymerase III subunit delta [Clostridia bacterium]